jgi:hypothetical protein
MADSARTAPTSSLRKLKLTLRLRFFCVASAMMQAGGQGSCGGRGMNNDDNDPAAVGCCFEAGLQRCLRPGTRGDADDDDGGRRLGPKPRWRRRRVRVYCCEESVLKKKVLGDLEPRSLSVQQLPTPLSSALVAAERCRCCWLLVETVQRATETVFIDI